MVGHAPSRERPEQHPVAVVRGGQEQALNARRPADDRVAIGRRRPQAGPHAVDHETASGGYHLQRRLGQAVHTRQRRSSVVVALFFGRPEQDLAIRAWHEVTLARPDHLTGCFAETPQGYHLALHGLHRHCQVDAARQVGAPHARGEHHRIGFDRAVRRLHTASALAAHAQAGRPGALEQVCAVAHGPHRQRLHQAGTAHLAFVGQPEPARQQAAGDATQQRLAAAQVV